MASSSSNPESFSTCLLRGTKLSLRPEELLRQHMVQEMLTTLGYPKGWLSIEVSLHTLATKRRLELPNRRIDIVAYMQNPVVEEGGLVPLLLIECKAGPFTARGWRQLLGYQHHIGAPFIALVTKTGCYFHALSAESSKTQPVCLNMLPRCDSLLSMLRP